MGHYKIHTEIVNRIFRIYANTIEKYVSYVKKKKSSQRKIGDSSQQVVLQQLIALLSHDTLLALKCGSKYLRH